MAACAARAAAAAAAPEAAAAALNPGALGRPPPHRRPPRRRQRRPSALRRQRRYASGPGYEDYLRYLQNQVVSSSPLLEDSRRRGGPVPAPVDQGAAEGAVGAPEGEEGGRPKVNFISFNKLLDSPEAPSDPMMLFRDIDNVRALAQRAGSPLALKDEDCATLVLEMLNEVRRGRQLMKDIVKHFERMEAHPDFYRVGNRSYNLMIYNSLARDYPALDTPSELYGRLLKKGVVPGPWTYVCLARVEMFLPPVERRAYKDAFLRELNANSSGLTPYQLRAARFLIEHLRWITDGARLLLYSAGLALTLSVLWWAYWMREEQRVYRTKLEEAMYEVLDERYYGEAQFTPGGRQGAAPAVRGGVADDDSEA